MYYLTAKLEISHFILGKMTIITHLKASHLNDRQTITGAETLKPKLLDYFDKIGQGQNKLSPLELCYGIVGILHPFCFKCSIKLDENKYIYEK